MRHMRSVGRPLNLRSVGRPLNMSKFRMQAFPRICSFSTDKPADEVTDAVVSEFISLDRYPGIAEKSFPKDVVKVLMEPLTPKDVEIKPDGIIYLPEIKYRRILNQAFGPGGWAMVPMRESIVKGTVLNRDYMLFCLGRFVAQAKGEHRSFTTQKMSEGVAEESAKSNALMRCCKDLGIASELWDPSYIIEWKDKYAVNVFCENMTTKKKNKLWRRKDRPGFAFPWKET